VPGPPCLLTLAQVRGLSPHVLLSHGVPRVDGRQAPRGSIRVIRDGLR